MTQAEYKKRTGPAKINHVQHEGFEQQYLFDWIAFARSKYPDLDMLYHVPNGGCRNSIEAANLKKQGVRAGVPDLCLPVARGGYHGLYIELKYGRNKPSEYQNQWISNLRKQGYVADVCYGWEEAKEMLLAYIKQGDDENENQKAY